MLELTVTKPSLDKILKLIPPLSNKMHKGQAGRIAVLGGSFEYTGAPYFSCMSSMRLGSDLGFIVCEKSASVPIKSYSPDIIVYPFLRAEDDDSLSVEEAFEKIKSILPKAHSLSIGPGLSRDKKMLKTVELVIKEAMRLDKPIILDADGLYIIQEKTVLIEGYKKAILTPNKAEFERLCKIKKIKINGDSQHETAVELSRSLGNVTLVQKGPSDIITNGEKVYVCEEEGGLKRCGGQGDILSGILCAFSAFGVQYENKVWEHDCELSWEHDIPMLVGIAACIITRKSSKNAFCKHKRAMQTQNVLEMVGESYEEFVSHLSLKKGV